MARCPVDDRPGICLVLCDLGLPGLDGVDLARAIRAAGIRLPLLAVSGRASEAGRGTSRGGAATAARSAGEPAGILRSVLLRRRCDGPPKGGASDDLLRGLGASNLDIVCAVDVIDQLIANNAAFTARHGRRHIDIHPSRRLAIVTCMDSRLDIFAALGLKEGEAHVLRNAGGVVTDDVVRSLAISQRRMGTTAIMLIHHTDCGMQQVTDDGFRAELQDSVGMAPSFAIESFADVDADVRQSIMRVRRSVFLAHRDGVRGFVYDSDSGHVREVLNGIAP